MAMEMIHDSFVNSGGKGKGLSVRGELVDSYTTQTSNSMANYNRVFIVVDDFSTG